MICIGGFCSSCFGQFPIEPLVEYQLNGSKASRHRFISERRSTWHQNYHSRRILGQSTRGSNRFVFVAFCVPFSQYSWSLLTNSNAYSLPTLLITGLTICGSDCLLSAEWKSPNKIIARTGLSKGKGDIIVTTISGGVGSSTVQFRAYNETIGPLKESAVWIEEPTSLAWGRRTLGPTKYTQEDPLGLSIEGNVNKLTEDLRDIFPDSSGDLSQENFSPGWFLLEHHNTTSFDDLKAGLSYLRRKVESQRDGQLSFLKANAGAVMDQLDTLMILRDKFEEDMLETTEPIDKLEKSIKEAIIESNSLFTDVLYRREKADTMRAALFALSRHK